MPTPIYRKIESHLWKVLTNSQVGDLMPTISDLCAQFGTRGVQTVRSAYEPLMDAGYVEVQQSPQRRWVVVAVPDHPISSEVSTASAVLDEVENDLRRALRRIETIKSSLMTASAEPV